MLIIKIIKSKAGIIISGGNNLYDFEKTKENLIRDRFELKMIKFLLKIKFAGICKGFQLIASFLNRG